MSELNQSKSILMNQAVHHIITMDLTRSSYKILCRIFYHVSCIQMSKLPFSRLTSVSWPVTFLMSNRLRPKLHYMDTGYGHHQRTSSQQFYNKFATSQCQSPTSRHVKMLGCGKFLSVGGEFAVQQVVELLWACPLVVSVASKMYNRIMKFTADINILHLSSVPFFPLSWQKYFLPWQKLNRELLCVNTSSDSREANKHSSAERDIPDAAERLRWQKYQHRKNGRPTPSHTVQCPVHNWQQHTITTTTLYQGGHKVGEKISEFSRLFQSHKLTFLYRNKK